MAGPQYKRTKGQRWRVGQALNPAGPRPTHSIVPGINRGTPMDQPVVPAWIATLNDSLNGLVVAALFLASTTEFGFLYQRGNPQFRSFSLASNYAALVDSRLPSACMASVARS